MADNLREVIAKRLANTQQSKTAPAPTPTPVPQETEEEDEEFADEDGLDDEEEVETPVVAPAKVKKVAPKQEIQQEKTLSDEEKAQIQMQETSQRIMMLQDNGIFRAELLHHLNGIERALTILASIGIDLTKQDGKE